MRVAEAGMEKIRSVSSFGCGILALLSLNLLWITSGLAHSDYRVNKELGATVPFPVLTPVSNTEPFSSNSLASSEVTSEAAANDIYDQISPSRDPTTPISRKLFDTNENFQKMFRNPSTLPTMLNAPPPFYHTT